MQEPRRKALINYAQAIGCELLDVPQDQFGLPKEFGWLAQLLWGQQLALELSKALKTNPDTVRADQPLYNEAEKSFDIMIWVIYCMEFGDNRDPEGESEGLRLRSSLIAQP